MKHHHLTMRHIVAAAAAAVMLTCSTTAILSQDTASITAEAYTAHTPDEAIAWVKSQLGNYIDWDGYAGAQCVDLIMAYYNYLGVSPVSGNGRDYASNDLPAGWQRLQGVQPQKGDILVYGASSSNEWGHVAIYESDRSTYHQNFDNSPVRQVTFMYNGLTNPYWGVIRPDWPSPIPTPSTPSVTVKGGTAISDTVISWGACTNADWYDVYIYYYGTEDAYKIDYKQTGTSYAITLPEGKYYATVAACNAGGTYASSEAKIFTVSPPPITGSMQITPDPKTGSTKAALAINAEGTAAAALMLSPLKITVTNDATGDKKEIPILGAGSSTANIGTYDAGTYTATLSLTMNSKTTTLDKVKFKVGEDTRWTYASSLPDSIEPEAIQYGKAETTVAKTSPGDEWTKGTVNKTVWENVGDTYTSNIELPTSDSRVLVTYYYYHYCGASKGNEANYEWTSEFNHLDTCAADSFYEVKTGLDSADSRYRWYYTKWAGTDTWGMCAGGTNCQESHDPRCYVWYKCSTYQDRQQVTYYNYSKPFAWSSRTSADGASGVRWYMAPVRGDVDLSGKANVVDAVQLQKWLLADPDTTLGDPDAADLNEDGVVDVFDLALLKRLLLAK